MTLKEEFYSHARYNLVTGCIEWTGAIGHKGYGSFRGHPAHRMAVRLEGIHIPKGMVVAHTCDNPPCVNVQHLRVATYRENSLDAARKGRVCKGPAHTSTKFSDAVIRTIREDAAAHGKTNAQLASEYGMSISMVSGVLTGGKRREAGGPIRGRLRAPYRSKLTDAQRLEIARSTERASVLARKYGVALKTIHGLREGVTASEVTRNGIDSVEIFVPRGRAVGKLA